LINVLNEFIYERGELNNPTDNRKFWLFKELGYRLSTNGGG